MSQRKLEVIVLIFIAVLAVAAVGGLIYWGRDQRSQEQIDMDNNRTEESSDESKDS